MGRLMHYTKRFELANGVLWIWKRTGSAIFLIGDTKRFVCLWESAEQARARVGEGARRAHRVLQQLDAWGAPADHPRLVAFPEGDYLKVRLYRAD